MDFPWSQIWILIPLAAIGVGAFKEWLKFKAKQDRIGTSTAEMEQTIAGLRKELHESDAARQALVQRLQNLETIVTTEMWDVVHGAPGRLEQPTHPSSGKGKIDLPEADEEVTDRVSRIADRLRNM